MKNIIALVLMFVFSASTFAEDVTVSTPDGNVVVYKGDLQTTSQLTAFYALEAAIDQCRVYIALADNMLSNGLNELQTAVDVTSGGDITFPKITELPPTVVEDHYVILQCLGPVQNETRQVTFSSMSTGFSIEPNKTTVITALGLYLTQLTVKSVLDSNYLTSGENYIVETLSGEVFTATLDADELSFEHTYAVGDQISTISTEQGEKLGDIVYNAEFGNVYEENTEIAINDGSLNISAVFVVGDVILTSPGLLVDNLPDATDSKIFDFAVRGLDAGDYNVVLTVDGVEVAYDLNVTIGSGTSIPSSTGRLESHTINSDGELLELAIDFTTMYEGTTSGNSTGKVVYLALIKGGEF